MRWYGIDDLTEEDTAKLTATLTEMELTSGMVLRWWNFTAGHYADEFAENHARDMLVREILSKSVPSAGVGSGYSRRALELLAADSNNQLFNIDSLTEDYDFGMRMRKFGLSQIFVRQILHRQISRTSRFTGKRYTTSKREYIVIREFFPRTFTSAVRQKSRWIMDENTVRFS